MCLWIGYKSYLESVIPENSESEFTRIEIWERYFYHKIFFNPDPLRGRVCQKTLSSIFKRLYLGEKYNAIQKLMLEQQLKEHCSGHDVLYKRFQEIQIDWKKLTFGSNRPQAFFKKDVLKSFAKFTNKQVCRSFFFNKETPTQVFFFEVCEILRSPF